MGCALAAAGGGLQVVLVEKNQKPGGTVNQALIHTIGGLFDDQGKLLNPGLPTELTERLTQASPQTQKRRIGKTWVLNVDPECYTQVVTDWLATTAKISAYYQTEITAIATQDADISAVTLHGKRQTLTHQPHALVDATGNANIVRHIDASLVDAGMALGGYIVCLRHIEPDALQFPKGLGLSREIRKAVAQEQLPPECATVWLDTGVYPDEVYVKFNVAEANYQSAHMQSAAIQLVAFLQRFPGFTDASIQHYGQLGIRDGGRIRGEYCLTATDVITGRQFTDTACQASWPIEHWHPEQGITLQYLPAGQSYAIPLRSLKVAGFSNLWAAGKCLSAEPRAQASARVVGTCWAMGEAIGKHISEKLQ
jgi:hypothetical protein